jgi:hypothetical protein
LDSSTSVKPKTLTPEECIHIAKIIEPSKVWEVLYGDVHRWEGFDIVQANISLMNTSVIQIPHNGKLSDITYSDHRLKLIEIPTHTLNKIEEYLKQINKNG